MSENYLFLPAEGKVFSLDIPFYRTRRYIATYPRVALQNQLWCYFEHRTLMVCPSG